MGNLDPREVPRQLLEYSQLIFISFNYAIAGATLFAIFYVFYSSVMKLYNFKV